jgi:predicted permease
MFWRRRKSDDFGSEIRSHLELEIDHLKQQGMSEEDARVAAHRRFGNVTRAEEQFYESQRWAWADSLWRNIRFGMRMLARSPGSSVVAILVLAVGIGATTAIFTLLNAVLLRSLPVQHPEQLVLFGDGNWGGSTDYLPHENWNAFSYHGYRDFERKTHVFSNVAAIDSNDFNTHGHVGSGANLEKMDVELASGTYFETLGVKSILGRTLSDADDAAAGAHPVAVASYSWWRRRFGSNPSALGATVTIGATVYSIIGITPPEFFGVVAGRSPDLWIPLAMEKEISPGWNGLDNDLFQSLYIIARRKPGVSMQQASAETNVLFRQIARGYAGPQASARQLEHVGRASIRLTDASAGISQLRFEFSTPLLILMGVAAMVLLIACINVANLMLARAAARGHEIAIRLSVGAARSQLIRQLLIESGLLGLAGAILGVALAWGASHLLLAMVSSGAELLPINVSPDARVLAFALVVTILTVLVFGTVPAIRATRLELAPSLKEGRGIAGGSARNRLTRGLIVGQVALSLALLSGAGLFLRSLANLADTDIGFDAENVLVTSLDATSAGYKEDLRLEDMMHRVEDRVDAIHGVQAASFATFVFNEGGWTGPISVPDRLKSDNDLNVTNTVTGAQYLNAMKIPVILGRGLNPDDTAASRKVGVINETMAKLYFPGGSPIGHTFDVTDEAAWRNIEVVGVVKDAKYDDVDERQMPAAYYPYSQHIGYSGNFVVRYTGDPKLVTQEIRRAVNDIDPNLPVGDFSPLAELVGRSIRKQRLLAQLSTLFGIIAALLACVGIYGVMSYGTARRTSEFGVRMAMGADRTDVLWMVLREALWVASLGVAIGIGLALASSGLVNSVLFGLKPTDPVAIGAATAVMIGVALFAGWLPARRATRIDPMIALRHE